MLSPWSLKTHHEDRDALRSRSWISSTCGDCSLLSGKPRDDDQKKKLRFFVSLPVTNPPSLWLSGMFLLGVMVYEESPESELVTLNLGHNAIFIAVKRRVWIGGWLWGDVFQKFPKESLCFDPEGWATTICLYGYGSIPIDTFLVGCIHKSQLFWGTRGYQGFDPSPYMFISFKNLFEVRSLTTLAVRWSSPYSQYPDLRWVEKRVWKQKNAGTQKYIYVYI